MPIIAILAAVCAGAIEVLLASRALGLSHASDLLSEQLMAPVAWACVPLFVAALVGFIAAVSRRGSNSWAGPAIAVSAVGPVGFFVAGFQGHNAAGVLGLACLAQAVVAVVAAARLLRSPAGS